MKWLKDMKQSCDEGYCYERMILDGPYGGLLWARTGLTDDGKGYTYVYRKPYVWYIISYLTGLGWHMVAAPWCRRFGHGKHWHDESWGGPDSGGMAGYCDRCGEGFSHTLY